MPRPHAGQEEKRMELPLQITGRDLTLSASLESEIRDRAGKLELFCDKIMRCKVVLEGPAQHHRKGGPFKVRIDLTVPGSELVVNHQSDEDLYVAVRDAFDAARRQLEDYVRRQRGDVKAHAEPPYGHVSKLFEEEGYGFIETADGREIYFHRNSVLVPGFENLKVGAPVRFTEEAGEKGPQATTVTSASK